MTTPNPLANSRSEPACAAFEPLLPLVSQHLLEPEEERHLQAHVAGCAHCRATLAAYDRLDAALRQRFEQMAVSPPHTEESMKKIEETQEREAPFAPVPRQRQQAAFRASRVFSWVGALVAVLVIALVAAALFASHRPTKTGNTPDGNPPNVSTGVYYTSITSGSSPQTSLYAVNPATGAVRWHIRTPADVTVYPVLVDHGVLYALAQDYGQAAGASGTSKPDPTQGTSAKNAIYAFHTSNGRELWHRQTGSIPYSVVIDGETLYAITADGTIFALNADTGAVKWHVALKDSPQILHIADGVIYVASYTGSSKTTGAGQITALNAADGSEKWHFDLHGSVGYLQASGGLVAVVETQAPTDANKYNPLSQQLSMLNASDGSVKWTYPGNGATVSSVFMQGDAVYVIQSADKGQEQPTSKLQALNASDGGLRWEKTYSGFIDLRPDQGAQNSRVYLTTSAAILALNAQDGNEAWHAQIGTGPSFSQLVAGTLFAQAQGQVYALNVADGSVRWHTSIGDAAYLTAATSQQVFGIQKATDPQAHWLLRFFALNALTGASLWHLDFTTSTSQPLVG